MYTFIPRILPCRLTLYRTVVFRCQNRGAKELPKEARHKVNVVSKTFIPILVLSI